MFEPIYYSIQISLGRTSDIQVLVYSRNNHLLKLENFITYLGLKKKKKKQVTFLYIF